MFPFIGQSHYYLVSISPDPTTQKSLNQCNPQRIHIYIYIDINRESIFDLTIRKEIGRTHSSASQKLSS